MSSINSTDFATKLARGRAAEDVVAAILRADGWIVSTADRPPEDAPNGPTMQTPDGGTEIAPDLTAVKDIPGGRPDVRYVEVKDKGRFSLYEKKGHWCTGIDERYWLSYLRVDNQVTRPPLFPMVCLVFVHDHDPKNPTAPSGVYWQWVAILARRIDHRFDGNDRQPAMVYWAEHVLKRAMSIEAFRTFEERWLKRLSKPENNRR